MIDAVIIDDTGNERCGQCSRGWTPAGIQQARRQVKARFRHDIQLRYVDLAKGTAEAEALRGKVSKPGLSLPALLVNGTLRISGEFDIRMLLDAIETEIEISK